ncbi:MAG: DUF4340 domain-containing protein [Deltaproteobacteria bacterium]|nr:DUF4340 domain-containing protein [Deltaproteobacteria bacterium]MBK7066450.1 DUF4340 domain-containing protein [Deltaproteobacteria bacterium]
MNSKGIGIGLAVLVVLGAATAYVYRPQSPDSSSTATASNPWSRVDAARIDHVTIRRSSGPEGQRTIELEKRAGAWVMTAPGRGPTEARAVEDLVDRFANMKVTMVRARSAGSHAAFEVDDAHATRVTLKAGSGVVVDLFVGAAVGAGTAVRVPSRPETFEVDQSITSMVQRESRDWRNREITHASRESVQSVEWINRNGTFRFTRNGETWSAAPGTTVERLDTARVGSLVDSVANLRATDFAAEGATSGVAADSPRVTLTTGGGDAAAQTVTVRLGNNSGDNESFAQREGTDTVFVVTRAMADSVNPAVTAFQAPLPTDGGTAADASAPAAPAAAPMGMPMGGPGGGSPQIPPEVMEQLRRQLQQQGAGASPH